MLFPALYYYEETVFNYAAEQMELSKAPRYAMHACHIMIGSASRQNTYYMHSIPPRDVAERIDYPNAQ
jgi:hypothetical protein